MKAQSALEFLIMFSLVLVIFTISIFIYFNNISEADQLSNKLQAIQLCSKVSSTLNSFFSLGPGAVYTLTLPTHLNYQNYTIYISSNSNSVKIEYGSSLVSCNLQNKNITNATGATSFPLPKTSTLKNSEGGIIIE